jgi:fatty-acyl-CoA synthase
MLELIDNEKATVMNAVPTMIIAMLQEPRFRAGQFDTTSLRCVISGGAPIPVALMEQVKAHGGRTPSSCSG